jgi:hypothetical protein
MQQAASDHGPSLQAAGELIDELIGVLRQGDEAGPENPGSLARG